MTRVSNLNHVALSVRDLDRSVRFYEEGLGLRKTLVKPVGADTWRMLRLAGPAGGRSVFLQGDDRIGQIELVQWDLPAPEDSRAKRAGDPGVFAMSFAVDRGGVGELYQKLVAIGARCYDPPQTKMVANYGEITVFMCEDPDGNQIEIVHLPSIEEVKAYRAAQDRKEAG